MADKMIATYVCTRNLYAYLPAAYMSFMENNPGSKVYLFIEDEKLPYDVPEGVEIVDCRGQTAFTEENCVNMDTGFKALTLLRATWAKLFTGKPNGLGIRTLPKYDKVFQFDVDTYVQENLKPIWDLDMADHWFAATQEYASVHKPRDVYWNLGFGLFGLDAIRRDGIDDYVIMDLRYNKYPWIDQDAFCRLGWSNPGKVYDLGVRYNDCSQTGRSSRPAIVHMCAEPGYKFVRDDVRNVERIRKWRKYYEVEACRRAGMKFEGIV